MTTKQVSIWDFPRLIPGFQFEQSGHLGVIPIVLLTWDLPAYEKEMKSEVAVNPSAEPGPKENEMHVGHHSRSGPRL